MKKNIFLLILIFIATSTFCHAETLFSGRTVWLMAQSMVRTAKKSGYLPASYSLSTREGKVVTISAVNSFELLLRAVSQWSDQGQFPDEVALSLLTLQPPVTDNKFEPVTENVVEKPVLTKDLGKYALQVLGWLEGDNGKVPGSFNFGETEATAYSLSAAQTVIAFAVLIDTSVTEQKFPNAIAVPLVKSPTDWTDLRNPLIVPKDDYKVTAKTISQTVTMKEYTAQEAIDYLKTRKHPVIAKAQGARDVILTGDEATVKDAADMLEKYDTPAPLPIDLMVKLERLALEDAIAAVNAKYKLVKIEPAEDKQVLLTGPEGQVNEAAADLKEMDAPPPPVTEILTLGSVNAQVAMKKLRELYPDLVMQVSSPMELRITANQDVLNNVHESLKDIDVPPPPKAEVVLLLNGTDMSTTTVPRGTAVSEPYCGMLHCELKTSGPVAFTSIVIDLMETIRLPGPGPHKFDIATPLFKDGPHNVAVVVTDTNRQQSIMLYRLTFLNGQKTGVTPMQK
ncbi:MAG: hypothetical protein WCO98_03665 [bacterium]